MHKYLYKNFQIVDEWKWLKSAFQRVWKTVESQGKVSEKSGNFGKDIEWQPCLNRTFCKQTFNNDDPD